MKMSMSLIFLMGSMAISAVAGTGHSGGGNAVVCFDNPNTSREILDPANPLRGFILEKHLKSIETIEAYDLVGVKNPFPTTPGETYKQHIKRLAKRFEALFPDLSAILLESILGVDDENITYKSSPLYRVYDENDSGPVDPERCVISTMAQQSDVGNATKMTIDQRLFNHAKHSQVSKHALFLHEYLYRTFRKRLSDIDSSRTRAVVQTIIESNISIEELSNKLSQIVPLIEKKEGNPHWGFYQPGDSTIIRWYVRGMSSALKPTLKFELNRTKLEFLLRKMKDIFDEGPGSHNFGMHLHSLLSSVSQSDFPHFVKIWCELTSSVVESNYQISDEMKSYINQIRVELVNSVAPVLQPELQVQLLKTVGKLPVTKNEKEKLLLVASQSYPEMYYISYLNASGTRWSAEYEEINEKFKNSQLPTTFTLLLRSIETRL